MTRSKRRQNRATLAVDLAELDAIINALVHDWGGDLDPGLLAYLDAKRENLRKRIGGTGEGEGEGCSCCQARSPAGVPFSECARCGHLPRSHGGSEENEETRS